MLVKFPKAQDLLKKNLEDKYSHFQEVSSYRFFYVNPYPWKKETVSWVISYLCSIVWQHYLHGVLVFGGAPRFLSFQYFKSLGKTYLAYSLSILLSSVINDFLVAWIGLEHTLAWVATVVATGILNYFTVKEAFKSADKPALP